VSVTAVVPQTHSGFAFRNHVNYTSMSYPRFAGDWTQLSDSGTVQRWLSGLEGSEIVLAGTTSVLIPAGAIVLVDRCAGGWWVSVPRNDDHAEIVTDGA